MKEQEEKFPGMGFIWDLDGTLLDSYEIIVSSLYEICREYHAPTEKSEILREVKTHSVSSFISGLEARTGIPFETLAARHSESSGQMALMIRPMENAVEILSYISDHGIPQFVFTHRGASTEVILKNIGIYGFFEEIVTGNAGFARKPDPAALCYLMQKYGLRKDRSFYVGDRSLDIACADHAGMKSILYLPDGSIGAITGRETCVVKDLLEIKDVVRRMKSEIMEDKGNESIL